MLGLARLRNVRGQTRSRLGFGTSRLFNVASPQLRQRLLASAYDHGMTHFDTAPLCGFGVAERELKSVLARRPDATVATKVGLYPPGGGDQHDFSVFFRKVAVTLLASSVPWLASALWWRMVEKRLLFPPRSTHHLHMVVEQEPLARNRIALSHRRADVFGSPLATIDWRVGATAAQRNTFSSSGRTAFSLPWPDSRSSRRRKSSTA